MLPGRELMGPARGGRPGGGLRCHWTETPLWSRESGGAKLLGLQGRVSREKRTWPWGSARAPLERSAESRPRREGKETLRPEREPRGRRRGKGGKLGTGHTRAQPRPR